MEYLILGFGLIFTVVLIIAVFASGYLSVAAAFEEEWKYAIWLFLGSGLGASLLFFIIGVLKSIALG